LFTRVSPLSALRLIFVAALSAVLPVAFALPASASTHGGPVQLSDSALVPVRHVHVHVRVTDHVTRTDTQQTYEFYDSTTPTELPAHRDVAVYANGAYQAEWSQLPSNTGVLWIDVSGSNPGCNVLDVEPGDASPATAATWAKTRLSRYPDAIAVIYTMRDEWPATKAAIATLPDEMRARVRWWIADPTGVPHIVPGSSATQWYWGSSYDISSATSGF
jgi:hypothetical protein